MRRLIGPLLAVVLLAGCGSGDAPTLSEPAASATTAAPAELPEPTVPAITEGAAREVAPEPEPVVEAEPGLDAEQILTATVLIASGGDLEAAITAGLIGEAEAEAALRALESGSIDDLLSE